MAPCNAGTAIASQRSAAKRSRSFWPRVNDTTRIVNGADSPSLPAESRTLRNATISSPGTASVDSRSNGTSIQTRGPVSETATGIKVSGASGFRCGFNCQTIAADSTARSSRISARTGTSDAGT